MTSRLCLPAFLFAITTASQAATVSIPAQQDATIYEDAGGALANGAGEYLHAGRNGAAGGSRVLRALLQFDVAGNVPAGATVTSVQMQVSSDNRAGTLSLYRLNAAWSEGSSDASSGEAGGTASAAGDVTWIHRAYNTQAWSSAGGDIAAGSSASATADSVPDTVTFSSAQLTADVQQMLDNPSANFGWMLRNDDEGTAGNAIQMISRQSATVASRPVLTVGYSTGPRPVLYYDFEEGGGTVISNKASAAGGTNGVLSGAAAAWVAGPAGGFSPSMALQFDGVTHTNGGVWVDTLYSAAGLGAGDYDYTVACWLNFRKTTGDCFIVGQSMNPNFLHLGIRNRNAHLGHYGADLTSTTLLNTGTWYHVAFVFEGGRTAGVQRIFINGVADRVIGDRIKIRDVVTNLIVGTADSLSGRSFSGAADDLAIYPVALAESQIAYLAAGGNPLTVPGDAALTDRDFFTAPYGTGGTWNLYERVGARHGAVTSWYGAYAAATSRVSGIAGITSTPHLVTISTNTENEFVRRLLRWDQTNYVQTTIENAWIGLSDDTSGVIQVSNAESGDTNVTLALRRAAFTNWIDGTPVTWTTWVANEPNDSAPGEDGIEIQSGGAWNDQRSGVPGTPQEGIAVDNLYIIEWDVNAPSPITSPSAVVRQVQAAMPAALPGATGTNDSFGAYWHRASGGIGELRNGVEYLLRNGAAGFGTVVTTNSGLPFLNHYDPDVPGNLNSGLFPSNLPYFAQVAGVTDVNYVVCYKGLIRLRTADAGPWTFGVHSDDGFALRVGTNAWQRVYGNGWRDHTDPTVMTFEYGTGDSSTRGVVNLAAGDHPIEYVVYNGTGGNFHELYAARGHLTNDADTSTWLPVGFFVTNGFATPGILDPGDGKGWTVWHSVPNTFGTIGNTNQAWTAVEPSILGDSNKTTWASINFYDLGSGQTTAAGSIPNSVRFPYDVEQTNNTELNVAMFMSAKLVIPVSGTYYLGFQGDDGSWLRVVGQPWSSVAYSYFTNASLYIEGDKLVCNQGGGNTRTIGLISLAAGIYDIESLWWQGTGGAHYEILGAHSANPIGTPFAGIPALGTGLAAASPIGGGLQLVSTNPAPDVFIQGFGPGNAPVVRWNGERGSVYAVQSSTNLLGSDWTTTVGGIVTNAPPLSIQLPATNADPALIYRVLRVEP